MDKFVDEPLEEYKIRYRQQLNDNAKGYFDELKVKANVNEEENKSLCTEYYKQQSLSENIQKGIKKLKRQRILFIILSIILFPLIALFLCLIFKKINPKLKEQNLLADKAKGKMAELKAKAESGLNSLYSLFSYNIPKNVIEKTIPSFVIDEYFNLERYFSLVKGYGFLPELNKNESAMNVLSGTYNEIPFIEISSMKQVMVNKTYVGSITIHWTTYERDSEGRMRTVHHSQVLTASSVHPMPSYSKNNSLIFASEAAPNLSFSRNPSGVKNLSDKEIEKKIEKIGKKVEKKAKKSVNDADGFTAMSNTEFEALFGAVNRNNEVEFRLLFTPLAQKNEIKSIRDKEFFGDDFYFVKNKKLNFITSEHSSNFDFSASPSNYIDFDLERLEKKFISFNENFFKNIYFDLIPILNIPLYQQTKPFYLDGFDAKKCGMNFNPYVAECLSNALEYELSPTAAKTRSIIKTKLYSSNKDCDVYSVTAYSFDIVKRIDNVPVLGGDGRMHVVPVWWDDYIPVSSSSLLEISRDNDLNGGWQVQQRGFKARILEKH